MYIRGLNPRNFVELAEAVPIEFKPNSQILYTHIFDLELWLKCHIGSHFTEEEAPLSKLQEAFVLLSVKQIIKGK